MQFRSLLAWSLGRARWRVAPLRRRRVPALAFGVALATFGFALHAAEDAAPAALPVITNSGEFWTLREADRQKPHALRFELIVYYYDPGWRLLWGESQGFGFFLPTRGAPLPLKAGQRVLLEGEFVPAEGVAGEDTKVTLLAERTLPRPLATAGLLHDMGRLDAQWVSLEGHVARQLEIDATHAQLDILSEGRMITTRVLLNEHDSIPQWVNARVRVNGVFVGARDPAGEVHHIDLWVPRKADVEVLGWLQDDPRFMQPRLPIEEVAVQPTNDWVHVIGEVRAIDAGKSLTVRDETGQVVVFTEQPDPVRIGDFVEVVGRPVGRNVEPALREAIFRSASRAVPASRSAPNRSITRKLRLVEQVMELRPEEASSGHPVALKGVVTWSDPAAMFFYLQDASGGIAVRRATKQTAEPPVGAMISVFGTSTNGPFAPEVELSEFLPLGTMVLPTPRPVTLEQMLTGAEEGRLVEARAYLRRVEQEGSFVRLDLTTAAGEFTALSAPNPIFTRNVGALIRVTGICAATANAQRQLTGVRLWLAGDNSIQVEEPVPADPFAAPQRSIASLRQFRLSHAIDHRVRLSGVVLHQHEGSHLYIQDGEAGLLVLSRETQSAAPGEQVEVVGFPGRAGSRLVLREAIWRRIGAGGPPVPLRIDSSSYLNPDADSRLVQVRAHLHEVVSQAGATRLLFRLESGIFEALLDQTVATLPRVGSVIELTGIYALEFDEYREPRSFRLHLRSADDVKLIQPPSWWTAQRALTIAGGLGLCMLLVAFWVVVLRRRVRQQTKQIRAQLEKEARLQAELERTTRLESLGVLAGGIAHDFNNLLTVVIANISLASLDRRVKEVAGDALRDAEAGAKRAAELTQQLLTFAKGGDPVRTAVSLPDVVREAANFARHGSKVRCEIQIDSELPPANVDRAQIGRVVHNLVLNATEAMTDGGVVRINLTAVEVAPGEIATLAPGRYVKLSIADNGPGISAEHASRVFDPYFSTKPKNSGLGLATVHSIVKKHQGHIALESTVGRGTTFHIWLPVTNDAPRPAAPSVAEAAPSRVKARVLFMDDEEIIRCAIGGLLRQLGHEADLVRDGDEALQAYRAAMQAGRPYDVVILDLTVPGGMGGKAAMEELRRLDPKVQAIVSSGYSSDPVLANHRAYGFCAVVPKPYEIQDLAKAIEDVVRNRAARGGASETTPASKPAVMAGK